MTAKDGGATTANDTFGSGNVPGEGSASGRSSASGRAAASEHGSTSGEGRALGPGSSRGVGGESIWANRDYVRWLIGDTTGMIGRTFSLFIVSFVVYDLTGSEGSAGLLQTIILVIMLVASIPGGVITDRSDRRRLIYLYSIFASVVSAGIFLYVFTGHLTYLSFVVLMSILALVHGFFGEATNAALRSIVSGTGFVKAQAANQGRDAAVHLAGRPLSGLFYGFFPWLPYLISTVFLAVQGFAFSRIERSLVPRVDEKKTADVPATESPTGEVPTIEHEAIVGEPSLSAGEGEPVKRPSMVADFVLGLRYMASRKTIFILSVVITLINFGIAGIQALMVLSLIAQGYPAVEVGYLGAATGIALILVSTVAGRVAEKLPTGLIAILTLVWYTLCSIPLVFSDNYWVMLGCSFALGLGIPIANAAMLGYILGRTPESFQGRVSSLINIVAQALSAFAPLIAGIILEAYNSSLVAVIFTGVTLASLVIGLLSRRVRAIPAPADWEKYE